MKKYILLILLPFMLTAEGYIISGGKDNTIQEIASTILIKAYSRANLEMVPLFLPLEQSLEFSNSGKTDGELARIEKISKLYPNLRMVPVSIVSAEAIAFSTDKNLKIRNWDDLKGHKITIVRGAKFIETATKDIPREFATSFADAFDKLHNYKTDIVVVPKLAGIRMQHDNNYKNISAVSLSLKRLKLYHFVNKKNAHLIPILTPILQKMKDSGEISYMRDAYLMRITRGR